MLILALAQVLLKRVQEKAELGRKKKYEGTIRKNRESTKVTLEKARKRKIRVILYRRAGLPIRGNLLFFFADLLSSAAK